LISYQQIEKIGMLIIHTQNYDAINSI